MGLTPEEEAQLASLTEKATEVVKPQGIRDVLHFIVSHLGSGPVHDVIHEAIDDIPAEGPSGPAGPAGPAGPPGPAPSETPETADSKESE